MPYGRPQTKLQFLQQQAAGWRQNLEQLEDQLQQKQQAD
jgi:hypothetical protein